MHQLGCGQLQGFYFGRPVPSSEIENASALGVMRG